MSKKIIFSLLFLLLFTKSLSAGESTILVLPHDVYEANQERSVEVSLIEREIIEWRTISKTIPVSGNILYAINLGVVLNQVGTKYLVKYAQIEWKGKTKEFELERTAIKSDSILERKISE